MTENDLIALYINIEDFYNRFIETEAGKKALSHYYGKRGPKRRMTVPEVMTLNILRIFDRTADLKTFHAHAENEYKKYFPELTNYENFLKATNKSAPFIAAYVQYQLYLARKNCTESVFYLDSTPVSVCENRYISSNKVSKGVASRGKSTKGCAGYILKKDEQKKMYESGRKPCTATRKNMRHPMTKEQFQLLRNRNCIENVWSVMKKNYNLIYHAARSVTGMFRHFFYSISAFLLHSSYKKSESFLPAFADCRKLEF